MLVLLQFCSIYDAMSRWGDEKTLRFIRLYRERECLWNTSSPNYKNKQAREHAYRSILTTFNDVNLDLKSVKTKIKNLRSVYHTELKKVKGDLLYGCEGPVYKPSLSWFDEMHAFLGDTLEDRGETAGETITVEVEAFRSSNNETELKQDTVTTTDKQAEHMNFVATLDPNIDQGITLDPIKNTHTDIITSVTTNLQTNSLTPSSSSQQSIRTPSKRTSNRRKRQHDSVFSTLHRLENTVSNIINTTQEQNVQIQREDEFHMFALSVAAQLRQLPLHVAIATQSKIQSILSEARIASIFSNNLSPPSVTVKKEDASDN